MFFLCGCFVLGVGGCCLWVFVFVVFCVGWLFFGFFVFSGFVFGFVWCFYVLFLCVVLVFLVLKTKILLTFHVVSKVKVLIITFFPFIS